MESMPLADNFEMLSDIYVLPMNVTEVWAQIYSDEAPYSLEKSMLELGEVFHSQGTWGEPTDEFIKIEGFDTLLHRVIISTSVLP